MSECIFCEIIVGRSAGSFVYRGDEVSAFLDLHQDPPGHILVVPNIHVARLADLDPEMGAQLFRIGQQLAAALRQAAQRGHFSCQGVNLFLADGPAAGQEVDHVHLHVMARSFGDRFRVQLPHSPGAYPARRELDAMAQEIQWPEQP